MDSILTLLLQVTTSLIKGKKIAIHAPPDTTVQAKRQHPRRAHLDTSVLRPLLYHSSALTALTHTTTWLC